MSRVEFQTPAVIAGESDRVRDSSMVDAASHGDAPALILARKRGDVSEAWLYSKQWCEEVMTIFSLIYSCLCSFPVYAD